ncbi:bifunctional transcriptional activator/DNA repair enzyme AdaA [Brevibacillus dissolubilis]|uniref:bifunctional transcriptional activator/DNA repair enzyme AdaA n=1 Tax=Brevibacillus dissolubilis TaxID=1844116 RepID=UPI001115D853|nr:Ada metal-binding domain-containing protein [Brevibacillus dissolubilis]
MNDQQWHTIIACDTRFDGQFFYGVMTTGIFCKPSCKSRTPRRDNVRIFPTQADAIAAGLRPCKRCRPEETAFCSPEQELTAKLIRFIDDSYQKPLTLGDMADHLFVSPFYLQKCFRKTMNLSPFKYLTQKRVETAKSLLTTTDQTISQIAQAAGFHTSAHFSTVFQRETGSTPSDYRLTAITAITAITTENNPNQHGSKGASLP